MHTKKKQKYCRKNPSSTTMFTKKTFAKAHTNWVLQLGKFLGKAEAYHYDLGWNTTLVGTKLAIPNSVLKYRRICMFKQWWVRLLHS